MKKNNILIPLFVLSLCLVGCGPVEEENKKPDNEQQQIVPPVEPVEPEKPVEIKYDEIFNNVLAKEKKYNGNFTKVSTQQQINDMFLLDENNKKVKKEDANKLLKGEYMSDTYIEGDKSVDVYDSVNKTLLTKEFTYDSDPLVNKYVENEYFDYYFIKNNKEYSLEKTRISGNPGYKYNKLDEGTIDASRQILISNELSREFPHFDTFEEFADLMAKNIKEAGDLILDTKIEKSVKDNVYNVKVTFSEEGFVNDGMFVKRAEFIYDISYTDDIIKSVIADSNIYAVSTTLTINNKRYDLIYNEGTHSEILVDTAIDQKIKLDEASLQEANKIEEKNPELKHSGIHFNIPSLNKNTYCGYMVKPQLPNVLADLNNVTLKFYTDNEKTNEVKFDALAFKSYEQYIFVDIIVNDGYALVYEKISGINNESNTYIKEINIKEKPNYTYRTVWDEKQAEPMYTYLLFSTVLLNDKPVGDSTSLKLENKKIYNVFYSIDTDELAHK